MSKHCPCHSGKLYLTCCQPFHFGKKRPFTPTQLMRSRYAAYALGKIRYIVQTERLENSHSQQDIVARRKAIKSFSQKTDFVGLQILDAKTISETEAMVTFHAILLENGRDISYTERSRFQNVKGQWLYVDGTIITT